MGALALSASQTIRNAKTIVAARLPYEIEGWHAAAASGTDEFLFFFSFQPHPDSQGDSSSRSLRRMAAILG